MSDHKPPHDEGEVHGLWGTTPLDNQPATNIERLLTIFQDTVQTLTNMKDHGRLSALHERMNSLLRRSDVCLSQNKKMRIDDPKDNRAAAGNHTAAGTGGSANHYNYSSSRPRHHDKSANDVKIA